MKPNIPKSFFFLLLFVLGGSLFILLSDYRIHLEQFKSLFIEATLAITPLGLIFLFLYKIKSKGVKNNYFWPAVVLHLVSAGIILYFYAHILDGMM